MISIKLNIHPKGKVICEGCKSTIKKGQWVENSSDFGIFHEDCYKEFLANEFPTQWGVWGDDVTEEDIE